jgi:hypothetical protein
LAQLCASRVIHLRPKSRRSVQDALPFCELDKLSASAAGRFN